MFKSKKFLIIFLVLAIVVTIGAISATELNVDKLVLTNNNVSATELNSDNIVVNDSFVTNNESSGSSCFVHLHIYDSKTHKPLKQSHVTIWGNNDYECHSLELCDRYTDDDGGMWIWTGKCKECDNLSIALDNSHECTNFKIPWYASSVDVYVDNH